MAAEGQRHPTTDPVPECKMKHETTRVLYRYWNDLRGSRLAPCRFDIEPSRIADILPDTFILEGSAEEAFAFRLAGTRLVDRFGSELRGRNVASLFAEGDEVILRARLASAATQGAVVLLGLEAVSRSGRVCRAELIVLPLVHLRPVADRFLGAVSLADEAAWHAHDPICHFEILSDEIVWPDGRPHHLLEKASRQVPFLTHIRTARLVRSEHRQFRVYDGGLGKPSADDR